MRLPDKVRVDEIYTTAATNWAESAGGAEPALTERGSFQGSTTTGMANRGRASFLVPTSATTGKTYYAGMKINNDGNAQYLSFSVTATFSETNIYNNGLMMLLYNHLNTADHSTTVALATIQAAATATSISWWETSTNQIATWQMFDQQTAVLAFNAAVGITDRTASDLPDTTKQLSLTGKRAIIPADGWKTTDPVT